MASVYNMDPNGGDPGGGGGGGGQKNDLSGDITVPDGTTYIDSTTYTNSYIASITIPDSVTDISDGAFANCESLTTVYISDNSQLRTIGNNAFSGCVALTDFLKYSLPITSIGTNAFMSCSTLQTAWISASVATIGDAAFAQCTGITTVQINMPSPLTRISNGLFSGCTLLNYIQLPESITSIGDSAFAECHNLLNYAIWTSSSAGFILPNNVTSIGDAAFTGCNTMMRIIISSSSSLTSIGNAAFSGCSTLLSIYLPSSVTSIGNNVFTDCNSLRSVSWNCINATTPSSLFYGSYVGSVSIGASVQVLPADLFYYQDTLTTVTFDAPSSLTTINDNVFAGCTLLTSIVIPSSVVTLGNSVFSGDTSLQSVTFQSPSSLETIGNTCFLNCTALSSITLPASIQTYGNSVFSGCTSLSSITLNNGIIPSLPNSTSLQLILAASTTTIDNQAFMGSFLTSIVIPSSVTSIGDQAFLGSFLTSIVIPSSVTSIGSSAFSGCGALTSITFQSPSSVTSIGDYAFTGCTSLASLVIPNSVTSLGSGVLTSCSALTSLTVGNSITSLPSDLLSGSNALKTLRIGTSVSSIPAQMFQYVVSLNSVIFQSPSSVSSIGDGAFYGCTSLATMVLPSSVTSIGDNSFYGCTSLPSITLPLALTTIGTSAFQGCSKIASITIPASLSSLGNQAFIYCSKLTSVTFSPSSSLTSIGPNTFSNCPALRTIQIPASITSLGSGAFSYDISLSSVSFQGVSSLTTIEQEAFGSCSALTSIVIPSSVVSVGLGAFGSCITLASATFQAPSSCTTIGDSAFTGCSRLTSFSIPDLVTTAGWGTGVLSSCFGLSFLQMSNAMTSIPEDLFSCIADTPPISTFNVGNSITTLTTGLFAGCSNLTNVGFRVPSSLTSIQSEVFDGCTALISLVLPSTVTSFNANAVKRSTCPDFANLVVTSTSLKNTVLFSSPNPFSTPLLNINIHVPTVAVLNGVNTLNGFYAIFRNSVGISNTVQWPFRGPLDLSRVDDSVVAMSGFFGNSAITEFAYPRSITVVNAIVAQPVTAVILPPNATTLNVGYNVISIVIPASVSSIAASAFYGDTELQSIIFNTPSSLTEIKNYTFQSSGLRSIVIPTGVTSINQYAFKDCTKLVSVYIPATVTSIGNNAFMGCTSLSSVTFESLSSITTMGANAFANTPYLSSLANAVHPTNLSISALPAGNQLQITWEGPTDLSLNRFSGYRVYMDNHGVLRINGTDTTLIQTRNIRFGGSYTIRVVCLNIFNSNINSSDISGSYAVTTVPSWWSVYFANRNSVYLPAQEQSAMIIFLNPAQPELAVRNAQNQILQYVSEKINIEPVAPVVNTIDASNNVVIGYLSAAFSWNPPSNGTNGITYNIYKNGVLDSSGGTATSYSNYSLTDEVQYSFQISAVNTFGLETEKVSLQTFTASNTAPPWFQTLDDSGAGAIFNILKTAPLASQFVGTSSTDSPALVTARMNLYASLVGGSPTLQQCATYFLGLSTSNYDNYIYLAWTYYDMYLSTDTAIHNQGVPGLVTNLPIVRSLTKVYAFCNGGADASLNYIPANYFPTFPADGSIRYPAPLLLNHSTQINRVEASAFGNSIQSVKFNDGSVYNVNTATGNLILPPDQWSYTLNGADILDPSGSPSGSITMPSNIQYFPSSTYFQAVTAVNFGNSVNRQRFDITPNMFQVGSTFTVAGTSTIGYDIANTGAYLVSNGNVPPNMTYTSSMASQTVTLYNSVFYTNFATSAQVLMYPFFPNGYDIDFYLPATIASIPRWFFASYRINTVYLDSDTNVWNNPFVDSNNMFSYASPHSLFYNGLQYIQPYNYYSLKQIVKPAQVMRGVVKFLNTALFGYIPAWVSTMVDASASLVIPTYMGFSNTSLPNRINYYYGNLQWVNNSSNSASARIVGFNPNNGNVSLNTITQPVYSNMFADLSSSLTSVSTNSVISVPERMCYRCTSLNSFPLSNVNTIIGPNAFDGCISLTAPLILNLTGAFNISSGAFQGCTSLPSLSITSTANLTIGASGFAGCVGLKTIDISCSGVLTVNSTAFTGCTGVTRINITTGVSGFALNLSGFTGLQSYTLNGSAAVAFPGTAGLTSLRTVTVTSPSVTILQNQFSGCTALQTVSISRISAVTTTSPIVDMFNGCSILTSVTMDVSSGITIPSIFNNANLNTVTMTGGPFSLPSTAVFTNCPRLRSVNINSINSNIGATCFANSSSVLTSLTLVYPPSATASFTAPLSSFTRLTAASITGGVKVNASPFLTGASSLVSLNVNDLSGNLPASLPSIQNLTIKNYSGTINTTVFPASLKTLTIGGIRSQVIAPYQFAKNTNLTNIDISGVTDISDGAFYGCTNLQKFTMYDGLDIIGDWAFANSGISGEVTIPFTVSYLGKGYYVGCPNIKSIVYNTDVIGFDDPTTIAGDVWARYADTEFATYTVQGDCNLLLSTDSSYDFVFTDISSNTTTTVLPNDYCKILHKPSFFARQNAIQATLQPLFTLYKNVSSSATVASAVNALVYHIQTAGNIAFSLNDIYPDLNVEVGFDLSTNTFSKLLDASGNPTVDLHSIINNHDATLLSYLQTAEASFLTLYNANNNIFSTTFDPSNDIIIALPYDISSSAFTIGISSEQIDHLQGDNQLVRDISNHNLIVVWEGSTQIVFMGGTQCDVSGTITYDISNNLGSNTTDVLCWIYDNFVSLSNNNSINFTFNNDNLYIKYLDYKQNSIITINSSIIMFDEFSMQGCSKTVLNISGDSLTIYNNAFNSWAGGQVNIKMSDISNADAGIFPGVNLFLGSQSLTINSNVLLINQPEIKMIDMKDLTLDDVPQLIYDETDISFGDTYNVKIGTYLPNNNPGFTRSYTMITFQSADTLKEYVLLQQPVDYFWAFRSYPAGPIVNDAFPYYNYYANKPTLPAPNGGIAGNVSQVMHYIWPDANDPMANATGLTSSFAPDSFSYAGYTFTRSSTGNNFMMHNDPSTELRAVTTAQEDAIRELDEAIGLGSIVALIISFIIDIGIGIVAAALIPATGGLSTVIGIAWVSAAVVLTVGGAIFTTVLSNYITTGSFTIGDTNMLVMSISLGLAGLAFGPFIKYFGPIIKRVLKSSGFTKFLSSAAARISRTSSIANRSTLSASSAVQEITSTTYNPLLRAARQSDVRSVLSETAHAGILPSSVVDDVITSVTINVAEDGTTSLGETIVKSNARKTLLKQLERDGFEKGLVTKTDYIVIKKARVNKKQLTESYPEHIGSYERNVGKRYKHEDAYESYESQVTPTLKETKYSTLIKRDFQGAKTFRETTMRLEARRLLPLNETTRKLLFERISPHWMVSKNFNRGAAKFREFGWRLLGKFPNAMMRAHTAYTFRERVNILRGYNQFTTHLFASGEDALDVIAAEKQRGDTLNATNTLLEQLTTHTSILEQSTLGAYGMSGKQTVISSEYTIAYKKATFIGLQPTYYSPTSIDPTTSVDAPLWNFQSYGTKGTNFEHIALDRDVTGYSAKVMTTANPLHLNSKYLWKNTYLGNPTTPSSAEVNVRNVRSTSVKLCVNTTLESELYHGRASVSYNQAVITECPNLVYSGATNLNIIIPSSITKIKSYAFSSTDGTDANMPFTIEKLNILSNSLKIETQAFYRSQVKNLYYPAGSSFGAYSFSKCGLRTAVAIPANTNLTHVSNPQSLTINLNADSDLAYHDKTLVIYNFTNAIVNGSNVAGSGNIMIIDLLVSLNYGHQLTQVVIPNADYKTGVSLSRLIPNTDDYYYTIDQCGSIVTFDPVNVSVNAPWFKNVITLTLTNTTQFVIQNATAVHYGTGNLINNFRAYTVSDPIVIQAGAFEGNTDLTTFQFDPNTTSIGDSAFSGSGLQSADIPPNVTNIGNNAFAGATSLTQVTLPTNLTSVGSNVFPDVSGLNLIVTSDPSGSSTFRDLVSQAPAGSIIYTSNQTIATSMQSSLSDISGVTVQVDVPPNKVQGLSAEILDSGVLLTWLAADTSGSSVVSYTVDVSGGPEYTNIQSPFRVPGLVNGGSYSISVWAVNVHGLVGSPSDYISVSPTPDAPSSDSFTNLVSFDPSGDALYSLYSFDLSAGETQANLWAQTDISSSLYNSIYRVYSASSSTNLLQTACTVNSGATLDGSGHVIFDSSLNNVSTVSNLSLTGLTAGQRYYILAATSSIYAGQDLSVGLKTPVGRELPLTLVKTGSILNATTGLIASTDTSLQTFTIGGTPVTDGDSLTIISQSSVAVVATSTDSGASVDICGGSGFTVDGSYNVVVTVTASDGVTDASYTVGLNVVFGETSSQTKTNLVALASAPTTAAARTVASDFLSDLSNNPTESQDTLLNSFLSSLSGLSTDTTVNVIVDVAAQLPGENSAMKQALNDACVNSGVSVNTAYDLCANSVATLVSSIPAQYRAAGYAPSSLALVLPDEESKLLTVNLSKSDLTLSFVPDVSYSMNAVYGGETSIETYTVLYIRTAESRSLIVDGVTKALNDQIIFSFASGPQRYIEMKAFASPIGTSGSTTTSPICFLGNAPVLTPSGYRRIDRLQQGDLVTTADGRSVAIQTVKTVVATPHKDSNPYIIPAGLYGATANLAISPRHRVAVPGRGMVEARDLGLQQMPMRAHWTYYNLGLPNWDTDRLVVASVETESLAPTVRMTMAEFKTHLAAQFSPAQQTKILRSVVAAGKIHTDNTIDVPHVRKTR